MRKLTIWVCKNLEDSDAYSIITKTRKEATELRSKLGVGSYSEPVTN